MNVNDDSMDWDEPIGRLQRHKGETQLLRKKEGEQRAWRERERDQEWDEQTRRRTRHSMDGKKLE